MRKPIVAGNWKMYKTRDEGIHFVYDVNDEVPDRNEIETIICAPAILLRCLTRRQGENLRIGAQNVHYAEEGAYTGEISPAMLASTGVTYCIIGHSERRQFNGETETDVNLKLKAALKHNIIPIVCVGETRDQMEHSDTDYILGLQVKLALKGITAEEIPNIIIAYEPIWAVGAKQSAPADLANAKCGFIRKIIAKTYNQEVANQIRILYGGSVNKTNYEELIHMENVDGALLGRASLDSDHFLTICQMTQKYLDELKEKNK
ncbi:MAG: triose-phosphate isomerase [Acholeplasmatales bacterium]|jgi:triosephosphate isomerase|nr:triose-phosphate isomerase [Acholeplasmatales bacterium]